VISQIFTEATNLIHDTKRRPRPTATNNPISLLQALRETRCPLALGAVSIPKKARQFVTLFLVLRAARANWQYYSPRPPFAFQQHYRITRAIDEFLRTRSATLFTGATTTAGWRNGFLPSNDDKAWHGCGERGGLSRALFTLPEGSGAAVWQGGQKGTCVGDNRRGSWNNNTRWTEKTAWARWFGNIRVVPRTGFVLHFETANRKTRDLA
ncbi:hypothetical protein C8A00DRAFT_18767, partial [Chaetomidium leptoderma]